MGFRLNTPSASYLPTRKPKLYVVAGTGGYVGVIQVTPLTAELWDGPASKAVTAFEFVKARLTGVEPNLGENRKVRVSLSDR